MFYSTRSKLIAAFLGVSLTAGGFSLFMGGKILYDAYLSEARNRVRLDLNVAREIYEERTRSVEMALGVAALGPGLVTELESRDTAALGKRLSRLAQQAGLDIAGVVASDGTTVARIGPDPVPAPGRGTGNPIAGLVLERGAPVSGTLVLDPTFLERENPDLARAARIRLVPAAMAARGGPAEIDQGMSIAAAVPVVRDGESPGVLYGAVLVNRGEEIVDKVRDTVFRQEIFEGRAVGTATIFLGDARVATNVLGPDGKRALGTHASRDVSRQVLEGGVDWVDRAFVVSDWYISAYEPITDVAGRRVGMLYVGVLEAKYAAVRDRAISIFALFTGLGVLLAIGLGYFTGAIIMSPVRRLIEASVQVSQGNFSPDLGRIRKCEVGVLQKTFSKMLASLRERDRKMQAESEIRMVQTEKQASVGRLAAGVAHEINNPLTGVLTYTHMLLRRKDLPDEVRSDLQTVAEQTERVRKIVKGLLDFSRQTKLDEEPADVNRLVRSTIALVENQALVAGVSLVFRPGEGLPIVTLDRNQMQSVILNMVINALDATSPGGAVTVSTLHSVSASRVGKRGVEIVVEDTGCGIPAENLDKLFDPFFTTKEVGRGTGLGLAVSYGIVEHHGGNIRVQSEIGRGSTFTIWLPAGDEADGGST